MPKILSEADVRFFDEHGYLAPRRVLSEVEVAKYRSRLESFESRYPADTRKLKTKAHLLCPWVDEIARHPRILDVYQDLIGEDILCYSMAFRVKKPDGKTFAGWHQDTAYGPIKPIMIIGALALSDCTARHGCLSVIPGSHRTGLLPHAESTEPDSILARGQYISAPFDSSNAKDLVLQAGEIALFNADIIHGSKPNTASEPRILLLVEMMPACTEQRAHRESAMLVRGVDTYGNYDEESPAEEELGVRELEHWQSKVLNRAKNVFANSSLQVSEAYGGRS
jgi:ectoine hydroxylase-related dioxygenase (phytanoyl-CoA dioxygenase family)